MNKEDIIALTRRIGTAELSARVAEHCALDASDPTTSARSHLAREYEAALPEGLLEEALASAQVIRVKDLSLALPGDDFTVREPTPGSVVIDVRPRALYESGHVPEALFLPWDHALRGYPSFDASRTYTICCEYGLLSAELARRMRESGLECVHLEGGMRSYRKTLARSNA